MKIAQGLITWLLAYMQSVWYESALHYLLATSLPSECLTFCRRCGLDPLQHISTHTIHCIMKYCTLTVAHAAGLYKVLLWLLRLYCAPPVFCQRRFGRRPACRNPGGALFPKAMAIPIPRRSWRMCMRQDNRLKAWSQRLLLPIIPAVFASRAALHGQTQGCNAQR